MGSLSALEDGGNLDGLCLLVLLMVTKEESFLLSVF
jgi:hypothetical protein